MPVLMAEGMRLAGHRVCCVGFRGMYEAELPDMCDRFGEVGALRLGSWGRALRKMGVRYAVMVGRIDKARIMHSWVTIVRNRPDLRSLRLFLRYRRDRRSHFILSIVARELEKDGVSLIDSTTHIPHLMANLGVMTDRRPTPRQQADIELGWPLLREMLRLDIGQSMAVRGGDVIAVEAVEGTDRMIERAGGLCSGGGWTLVKGARVGHDRRSDVPTIGPETIHNLHRAGGGAVAVAADDVIIIDKPATIALADRLGIAIVGISPA